MNEEENLLSIVSNSFFNKNGELFPMFENFAEYAIEEVIYEIVENIMNDKKKGKVIKKNIGEKFVVYDKNNRDTHYFFTAAGAGDAASEEIYHKIINTLDCSKYWVYYSLEYLLKTYKKICDTLGYDYEFIYIEDITNNMRSFQEILSLMDKFPEIIYNNKMVKSSNKYSIEYKGFLQNIKKTFENKEDGIYWLRSVGKSNLIHLLKRVKNG